MVLLLGFAFLAGIITVASPCILPLLPVVLASSVVSGRRRPLGVITGFLVSFSILTLSLSFLARSIGLKPDSLRLVAAAVIVGMALILVIPPLKNRFMAVMGQVANGVSRSRPSSGGTSTNAESSGFIGGLLTGLSLGVVWTPCVGPIMASVITLAVSQSVDSGAVAITLAYAFGTAVPLFAVMQGGRAVLRRFPSLLGHLDGLQRVFGVLMLITGIALFTGADRRFQSWVLDTFPAYGSGLSSLEDNKAVKKALDARSTLPAVNESSIPDRNGSDPLTRTSGHWFNSQPLMLSALTGKVVLVDFWTYSCVNCLRTLPYLRSWHERYAADGLVIVGVHSPEFAFEADAGNLQKALGELNVGWPVVQDNDFGIWHAFSNRYWPAHYLFDRSGTLVQSHFGEGNYSETEAEIRRLLGLAPLNTAVDVSEKISQVSGGINEETYLGSARGQKLTLSQSVPTNGQWTVEGDWMQSSEYLESAGVDSILRLDVHARSVFLVISTVDGGSARIDITFNGKREAGVDAPDGVLLPVEDRLYQLLGAPSGDTSGKIRSGQLELRIRGKVRLHAFTFS